MWDLRSSVVMHSSETCRRVLIVSLCVAGCGARQRGADDLRDHSRGVESQHDSAPAPRDAEVRAAAPARTEISSAETGNSSADLSEEGQQRVGFAIELSLTAISTGSPNIWVALPPDGKLLGLVRRPYCTDVHLRLIDQKIDWSRIVQLGFEAVACYPEFKYSVRLRTGAPPIFSTPGDGDGWYCVLDNRVGLCMRSAGLCGEVAQGDPGRTQTCDALETAYCTTSANEERCFPTAEICVALRGPKSTPCVAKR